MKNSSFPFLLLMIIILFTACSPDEKIPPTVTFGVIQDNMEVVKGTPIAFSVNASDEDGEVVSVLVRVDSEDHDTANTAPYRFSWETLDQSPGEHSFVAVATDNDGQSTSTEIKVKVITNVEPVMPCSGAITISFQGQTYNTVQIGDQCWLKENLNVATEGSVHYNNDQGNGETYGRLYNWQEAMTACPPGWHLPDNDEWCALVQHVDASAGCTQEGATGTDAGFKLKSAGGWANEFHGSDQFGFKARPGGFKAAAGNFTNLGNTAAFWTATEAPDGQAYDWSMTIETTMILNNKAPKADLYSVRCIRD